MSLNPNISTLYTLLRGLGMDGIDEDMVNEALNKMFTAKDLTAEMRRYTPALKQFTDVGGAIALAIPAGIVLAGTATGLAGGAELYAITQDGSLYLFWSSSELNAAIGAGRVLLKELLGPGKNAAEMLRKIIETGRIPEGLSREALELYREISIRVITSGRGGAEAVEMQKVRLKIVEEALKILDRK